MEGQNIEKMPLLFIIRKAGISIFSTLFFYFYIFIHEFIHKLIFFGWGTFTEHAF